MISASPGFITGGLEFSFGRKDKSPMIMRSPSYFESLNSLSSSYVVLYDTSDQRAWLSNGVHTLLHLVRASLREDQKGLFGDECLLNHSLLEEDPDHANPEATIRFLRSRRNLEQPVFPALDETHTEQTTPAGGGPSKMIHHRTSTTVRLKDRVTQVMEVLWQLIDHQATLNLYASGAPIRLPRSKLEGYRFMEVASRRQVTPRVVHLRAFGGAGKSWVDFIRAIRGVVLFGDGFGELIAPASPSGATDANATCSRWMTMPKGKDYLAAGAYDLNRIILQEGSGVSGPVKLAPGIFWDHSVGAFDRCDCDPSSGKGKGPASLLKVSSALFCRPCDRVQVLLPARMALIPRGAAGSARTIGPNCAFIFGRSELFPWKWPDQGDPQQDDQDPVEEGSSSAATETDRAVVSAAASSSTTMSPTTSGDGRSRESMSITPPTTAGVSSAGSQLGDSSATTKQMRKSRLGQVGIRKVWESIKGSSSGGK